METQELTQIVTAHQQVLARHEQAIAAATIQHNQEIQDIRAILNQVGQKLNQVAAQQDANTQQIARLTENLLQLGNFVADDMRRRSQP